MEMKNAKKPFLILEKQIICIPLIKCRTILLIEEQTCLNQQ
jgi:hypothetical protein